jgi:hypothetical protein
MSKHRLSGKPSFQVKHCLQSRQGEHQKSTPNWLGICRWGWPGLWMEKSCRLKESYADGRCTLYPLSFTESLRNCWPYIRGTFDDMPKSFQPVAPICTVPYGLFREKCFKRIQKAFHPRDTQMWQLRQIAFIHLFVIFLLGWNISSSPQCLYFVIWNILRFSSVNF